MCGAMWEMCGVGGEMYGERMARWKLKNHPKSGLLPQLDTVTRMKKGVIFRGSCQFLLLVEKRAWNRKTLTVESGLDFPVLTLKNSGTINELGLAILGPRNTRKHERRKEPRWNSGGAFGSHMSGAALWGLCWDETQHRAPWYIPRRDSHDHNRACWFNNCYFAANRTWRECGQEPEEGCWSQVYTITIHYHHWTMQASTNQSHHLEEKRLPKLSKPQIARSDHLFFNVQPLPTTGVGCPLRPPPLPPGGAPRVRRRARRAPPRDPRRCGAASRCSGQ